MIKIDEQATASRDSYGWTLKYKTPINKSKLSEKQRKKIKADFSENITYHANLNQVLMRYVDISMKNVSGDLKDVLQKLNEIELRLKKIPNYESR